MSTGADRETEPIARQNKYPPEPHLEMTGWFREISAGDNSTLDRLTPDDWSRFIDFSRKHGILPVLYHAIKDSPPENMPPDALQKLRKIYLGSAHRNILLYHELEKILEAFHAAGITVIPLKGAWLAETVYQNIALRAMGDVDLWVQRSQLDAARQTMCALGYAANSKADRPQELQDELTGETQMFKAGSPMVEIHWNVFPGEWLRHTAQINEQEIWERTLPHNRENMRHLSPEDAVIHICVHLAVNHQMSSAGLRTLLDLDCVRQNLHINWATVAQRAREWRVSTATWLVLQLLAELFGDPAEDIPLRELSPSPLRQRLIRRFVSLRKFVADFEPGSGPNRLLLLLVLVDRPADMLFLIWRALVPDHVWLTLRYGLQNAPAWRIWLQRLWHPLLIAWQRNI